MCLLKAATIIRQDLFASNSLFNGNFDYSSQESSVLKSLLVLLIMILESINISSESSHATNQAALSLAQLIKFNSIKRKPRETTIRPRHTLSQETPLPVYLGLKIHSKTRIKGLIEKLAALALSISYNRVSEIQEQLIKQEIKRFDEMGLVCPKNLKPNIFTTAAINNIDHNSTSSTSQSHFHGTSVSVFQHSTDKSHLQTQNSLTVELDDCSSVPRELPHFYTEIQPMSKVKSDIPIQITNTTRLYTNTFKNAFDENKHWLQAVRKSLKCNNDDRKISWSAFHQERLINKSESCRISASTLLPLINESINSSAMVAHCMRVIIQHLDPTQIPVITGDQYALMKQVQ